MAESRVTSFLKSWTGMLTAAASLAAAIAALLTALAHFGGGSASPAETRSVTPAPAASTPLALNDPTERELQSHVPGAIWPTCTRPTDAEAGAVAAYNCTYRRIVGLQYNLFATSTELEADYKAVKQRYGLSGATPGASCAAGKFEGGYRAGSRVVGHLLCFLDHRGHVAAIVWTRGDLDILSFAWRSDMNLPALFEVWRKGVGPDE